MSVHGNHRMPEGRVQKDIGSFASHTRQGLQSFRVFGNFSLMLFAKLLGSFNNVFGFSGSKTDSLDMGQHFFWCSLSKFLWSRITAKERGCDLVDCCICRLCTEDDSDQKFEGVGMLQFCDRFWNRFAEILKELLTLSCSHWSPYLIPRRSGE